MRENWRRKNCVNHWINCDWWLFIRLQNSTFVRTLIVKFYTVQFWLLSSFQPKIWQKIPKNVSSVTRSSDTCLIHWNTVRAIYILSNFIHDPESDDATSRLDSFLLNSDTNGTRARCLSGRQEGAKLYCFSKLDCFCGKNFSPPWNRLGILNFKHFFSHFTVWYEEPGTEFCGKLFSGFQRYLWTKLVVAFVDFSDICEQNWWLLKQDG